MADPFSLSLAVAVFFPAIQEQAGNLVPEFVGDLASPRERLKQLRERLDLSKPDENRDLFRALTDAYWLALLQVVAHEGEAAGALLSWPDALGAGSSVTQAWRRVRAVFASVLPLAAIQSTARAEIALKLYPLILERLQDSLKVPPLGMDAAYTEVESLFVRAQESAPQFAQTLLAEAGKAFRSLASPLSPTEGMEDYLQANWFLLFRGALTETVKRNEQVERILNTTLLAGVHQDVREIRQIVRSNIPSMGKRPFVGREALLERIASGLGDVGRESVAVLHGQPGVGKSEVAREFARRNRDLYSGGTFWIDSSRGGLGLEVATIGETILNLAMPAGLTIEEQGHACFRRLGAEPMLLIYDNVLQFEEISEWLPVSGMRLHVLLTTFVVGDERAWEWIEVPLLTEEESIALAREVTMNELSEEKCLEIARFAGGLSIQVVSDAAATNVELRRRGAPVVGAVVAAATGESFARPYALLDADARLLAHAVRYLSPQRIPIAEISLHLCRGAGWSEVRLGKALDLCEDLHLVALDTHLSMHQLFAKFLDLATVGAEEAAGLREIRREQWKRFRELAIEVAANPVKLEIVSLFVAYPTAFAVWRDVLEVGLIHEGLVVGQALKEVGRFAEAQPWFEQAFGEARQADRHGRMDRESLGRSLHQVGYWLSSRGRFAEAQPWFEQAVEEKRQGDTHGRVDHVSLGRSLGQVGDCLASRGQFVEAQRWFAQAIEEKRQGDIHGRMDHARLGRSLHQVGFCLVSQGQLAEAQSWFEQAVKETRQGDTHGRVNHESLGRSLHQVGYCLSNRGQFAEAQPWFEQAVEEKRQGDTHEHMDHASLGISMHQVGFCLSRRGQFAEAQPWLEQAAEEARQGDGHGCTDHSRLGSSLHMVGYCLWSQSQFAEAQSRFEEAAGEARQGDLIGRIDRESLARSLDWVGECRAKLGDAVGALEWRALAAKERALTP